VKHVELTTTAGKLAIPELDSEATSKLHLTWHWSAGSYRVTSSLLEHYHFVIDKHGKVRHGVPLELNISTRDKPRDPGYARHVLNANSNNIGIAAAAMGDAQEHLARQGEYGKWPMTQAQLAGMTEVAAQICAQYGIPVLPTRVLGHEEWDSIHGRPQDRWDVNCIPHLDLRPYLNSDGTYESTNYLRRQTAKRVAELHVNSDPGERARQLAVFREFVELHDAAYAAGLPVETIRVIKQLRQLPPFSTFTRQDLTTAGSTGNEDKPGADE